MRRIILGLLVTASLSASAQETITTSSVATAEKILGISFSEAKRDSMLGALSSNLKVYNYIHSKNIYNRADLFHTSPRWLADRLTLLKRSGYVVRSCSDPGRKYNPGLKQKQFVNLSSKGVQLIKDMERDIYRILVDGCLTDLTGTKKKPRRISRA